jgi:hypothetical protein
MEGKPEARNAREMKGGTAGLSGRVRSRECSGNELPLAPFPGLNATDRAGGPDSSGLPLRPPKATSTRKERADRQVRPFFIT